MAPISQASATASLATSGLKDSISLDSLDAKMLQYQYATQKILKLISNVKLLIKNSQSENLVPSYKYTILLCGCIFNVNDNIYRRSEILINGNKFNPAQSINPPVSTSAVSFDCMDNSTNYDTTRVALPVLKKSVEQLRLLELLLFNAFEVYNNRLKQATVERNALRQPDSETGKCTLSFHELDDLIDFPELTTIPALLNDPLVGIISTEEKIKGYLRVQDIKFLKLNIPNFETTLNKLRSESDKLLECRTKEKLLQDPHYKIVLHRGLALLLHFADLYGIVRKFGKLLYLSNSHYLENYAKTDENLKIILKNLDIYFNQSKKNSLLQAMIVRLTRQNSNYAVRPDNVLEFYKVCNDSHGLLKTMLLVLQKLDSEWQHIIDSNRAHEFDKDFLREKLKQRAIKEREEARKKQLMVNSQAAKKLERQFSNPDKTKLEIEKQSRIQKQIMDAAKESCLMKEAEYNNQVQQQAQVSQLRSEEREKQLRDQLSQSGSSSPISLSRSSSVSNRSRSSSLTANNKPNALIPLFMDSKDTIAEADSDSSTELPLRRTSSLSIRTPTKSSSLARRNSVNNHPSVNEGSSSAAKRDVIYKRASMYATPPSNKTVDLSFDNSTITPVETSPVPFPSSNPTQSPNAVVNAGASSATMKALFQGSGPTYKPDNHVKAAVAATKKVIGRQPLTAQQRMQQHILKSQQNGTAITKVLDNRPKPRPIYKPLQQPSSPLPVELPKITLTKDENPHTNSITSSSDVGMSPLNSLKIVSQDNQKSLQVQAVTRSRSNSSQSTNSNSTLSNSNNNSPCKSSPSISRNRSRSNSNNLSNRPIETSNGIRNRSNSVSKRPSEVNSANRSRSNSASNRQVETNNGSRRPIDSIAMSDIQEQKVPAYSNSSASAMTSTSSNNSSNNGNNNSSETSTIKTRSRSSSLRKPMAPPMHPGNLEVAQTGDPLKDETGNVIKKVRFFDVPDYSEEEDAPTPQQLQKQIRQKWSSYKPQFRNRTKLLNSQEGLAFRKFTHGGAVAGDFEGFGKPSGIPMESNGKFSMMSLVNGGGNDNGSSSGQRKITKLFKRR